MISNCHLCERRDFLKRATLGSAAFFTVPGVFAEALTETPPMTEGPFYPDKLPLDTDNDLLRINDGITPAVGAITHLHGKVTDLKGNPVSNARVEIWQADHKGAYIHSKDGGLTGPKRDANFQGFGRFMTGRDGRYYFRTIKPVPYGPRTPHIHVAVYRGNKRALTTQCFIHGDNGNAKDGLIKRLGDPVKHLMVKFAPIPNSKAGELSGEFNIVLGVTPDDGHE
ncbi:protocatechuate 3,4-dioxygenase [bacterium]|nr:protocatechuate 3,4-dioxygenase [bacterium]MDB4734290.1 protocatechuate 3,4-dioxygenase [Akkermansiaceae bacterium]MDB4735115.1 protocatechuate 3,4-dioxygenase [Akkermansiaceae bacterium]